MSKFLQTLGLQPRISLSFSRSLEQFLLTVGQNDFGNKPPILKGQVGQHQNQIYPLDCMRTSRNLKGQPGKLKERQGAPTGYYYYILQLRRVGLRLYRSSFPELSLPEGAGGAEAAARRNSARLKIMGLGPALLCSKLKKNYGRVRSLITMLTPVLYTVGF